jgi:hypothetical protein
MAHSEPCSRSSFRRRFATGSSLTFNFAGIFGASLAPYIATWLARTYGLSYVGYYLTGAALLTMAGLLGIRETKDAAL